MRPPYLDWAEAHFYKDAPPTAIRPVFPMSWEARASEAEYWRMTALSPEAEAGRIATPHTWHAAEMFLYLLDHPQPHCDTAH